MKTFGYFLIIMCFCGSRYARAQVVQKPLLRSGAFQFNHQVYLYGYEQAQQNLLFKCYAYSPQLICHDSIRLDLGKHTPADFLDISTDTLHGGINFYFQRAGGENTLALLRTSPALVKTGLAEHVDANHVNTVTAFDDEKYACGNDIYVIKTVPDSTGRQFFLSKYSTRYAAQSFDYDFRWQFAFERQFIHRAAVVYADSSVVMVYVNVTDSTKKGQWLLRIDARTGKLVRGTRLNYKGDNRYFLYSNAFYDRRSKAMTCVGNIYPQAVINFKTGQADFSSGARNHQLFVIKIDSLGDIVLRSEKPLPLPVPVTKAGAGTSYHLKVRQLTPMPDKKIAAWTDLYEMGPDHVLRYYTSWYLGLDESDAGYEITPGKFSVCTSAVPGLISNTGGDMYGKFLLRNPAQYDQWLYARPLLPVVVQTALTATGDPVYTLLKKDLNAGIMTYYRVLPGKKGLVSETLLRSEKDRPARLFFISPAAFISCVSHDTSVELKVVPL